MAFSFLKTGAAKIDGQPYFPTKWDPVRRVILSDNPIIPGFNLGGQPKGNTTVYTGPFTGNVALPKTSPSKTTAGTSSSSSPSTSLPPLFSTPSRGASAPAPAAPIQYPVYPATVPQSPGVSKISVPRSDNVAGATGSLFQELEAVKGTVGQAVADFKAQFPEYLAGQQETAATERAATQQLFDGGERARIDALLADFEVKANAANAKSIADTQRLRSRQMIAQGGNRSSAFDRGQFEKIAEINARAASEAAGRALTADQWLAQLQQQMAGGQANRDRQTIADTLLPAQVDTNAFQSILQQLAVLSPIEQQNLLTGLVSPGGYIGDSFGGLQTARLQDLARLDTAAQRNTANELVASKQAFDQNWYTNQLNNEVAQGQPVTQSASPDVTTRQNNELKFQALTPRSP